MLKLTRLNEPIMTNKNKPCLVYITTTQQVMQNKIQCKFQLHVNIIYFCTSEKTGNAASITGYVKLHVDAKHDL